MASANLEMAATHSRLPANPWLWVGMGGGLTLGSWIWTLIFKENASDNRVILLAIGLFFTGVGIWIRWSDLQTEYINRFAPVFANIVRLALALVLAAAALGVTFLLGMAIFAPDKTVWNPGATSLVWLSVAPVSLFAAKRCLTRNPSQVGLDAVEEVGLSLVIGALCCFVGSLTLDLGGDYATDWDSIRMFLRVVTAFGVFAAALVLVTMPVRRMVLSLLIVLHFAGITTACLSAEPSPWLVQQLWTRLFRPYLEFMYLNNAHHYYAPEPGPASYFWFRLIYVAPDGREYGWWYKVPQLDENGKSNHTVALEYQRFLAMTESASRAERAPGNIFTNDKGELDTHEIFKNRLQLVMPANKKDARILAIPNEFLRIPLEPTMSHMQQLQIPNESSRQLIASFARFVARKFAEHPDRPDWKFKSVKIYRVVHQVMPSLYLANGIPPTDPELYMPYYQGNYTSDGSLIRDGDPYLYWLLPVLRHNRSDPGSKIRNFASLHAGDSNWVRPAWRIDPLGEPPPWGQPDDEDLKLVAP